MPSEQILNTFRTPLFAQLIFNLTLSHRIAIMKQGLIRTGMKLAILIRCCSLWHYMLSVRMPRCAIRTQVDTANWKGSLFKTNWGRDKWSPFSRWHIETHFLEWKLLCFDENCFTMVQLTLFQHWWLGAGQATSHYLKQWWLSLMTHICVTRPLNLNYWTRRQMYWFYS